jgi:hypothetical protein
MSMALQQAGIPDNVAYLVLGLVVLFGLLGGWLASYFVRLRNLRRDLELLQQMQEGTTPASGAVSGHASTT